ncbi:MAG: 50S ribosomal protein L11 [Minisyncoccales bacterium]
MKKKIKARVKLLVPGGQATPAPPVGPALAQHGLDIRSFCEFFNEKTKKTPNILIPVEVIVFEDRTFQTKIKTPSVTELLKREANIEKGSKLGRREIVGKISKEKIREIAKIKMPDLNTNDLEKAIRIVEGTAKNMGLEIE